MRLLGIYFLAADGPPSTEKNLYTERLHLWDCCQIFYGPAEGAERKSKLAPMVSSYNNSRLFFVLFVIQVDAATFEATIEHINDIFDSAEALSCRNISEGCLSCITGYTLHYCFKTNYEQVKIVAT